MNDATDSNPRLDSDNPLAPPNNHNNMIFRKPILPTYYEPSNQHYNDDYPPAHPPSMSSNQPRSKERVLDARKERNRIAARKSRERKSNRVQKLEEEKRRLEARHDELARETLQLQRRLQEAARSASSAATLRANDQNEMLHQQRQLAIQMLGEAYNNGNVHQILHVFHPETVIYGPQSYVQLRGQDAIVTDYAITSHLYRILSFKYTSIERDVTGGSHYRAHWIFSGQIKRAGDSKCEQFSEIVASQVGMNITIQGVTHISFSGPKIIYIHRFVDQSKVLRVLFDSQHQSE